MKLINITKSRCKRIVKRLLSLGDLEQNLFIVGAQKAGTSSLHTYLDQHPLIVSGMVKEVGYFHKDILYSKGGGYYRSYFPINMSGKIALDSTPENLYIEKAAQRICSFNPNSKILIILRDPILRAFSAYNMYKQAVGSDVFKAHLKASNDDVKTFFMPIAEGKIDPSLEYLMKLEMDIIAGKNNNVEPALIRRGLYAPQIERYIKLFGRDNVLILFSDDLRKKTGESVSRVFNFLGLENIELIDTKPRHVREYTVDISGKDQIEKYAGELFDRDKSILKEKYNLNVPW